MEYNTLSQFTVEPTSYLKKNIAVLEPVEVYGTVAGLEEVAGLWKEELKLGKKKEDMDV